MWEKLGHQLSVWSKRVLHGVILLHCIYLIWGWITISDIKTEAQRKGLDVGKVLESLQVHPSLAGKSLSYTNRATGRKVDVEFSPQTKPDPAFGRLAMGSHSVVVDRDGNVIVMDWGYLDFFFGLSENALNVLFCFGIGYVVSSVIVLLRKLKKADLPENYYILRPLVGGAVSSCLFLIVLSGGNLLWQQTSGVNGLSIGVIATLGSVYCERFESMLKSSLHKTQETRTAIPDSAGKKIE